MKHLVLTQVLEFLHLKARKVLQTPKEQTQIQSCGIQNCVTFVAYRYQYVTHQCHFVDHSRTTWCPHTSTLAMACRRWSRTHLSKQPVDLWSGVHINAYTPLWKFAATTTNTINPALTKSNANANTNTSQSQSQSQSQMEKPKANAKCEEDPQITGCSVQLANRS